MTREEAIIVLKNTAFLLRDGTRYMKPEHEKQFQEAYEMSIKALEQQERKKGQWYDVGSLSCRCSECGCKSLKEFLFCPNCGTYMRKKVTSDGN